MLLVKPVDADAAHEVGSPHEPRERHSQEADGVKKPAGTAMAYLTIDFERDPLPG